MAAHMVAFLHPDDRDPPCLGHVLRLQAKEPRQCLAGTFLYHLLSHSTRPDSLASEMLKECLEICEVRKIVLEVYETAPHNLPEAVHWADRLRNALPPTSEVDPDSGPLPALNRLASHYLTHLCIAIWSPTGPSTPQASTHTTPDHFRAYTTQNLLELASDLQRSSALKELVECRDGFVCPVSDWPFVPENGGVYSELAHILPFSLLSKTKTHQAIAAFTGMEIDSVSIIQYMDRPENTLLLQHDAHNSFDRFLGWGIEAITDHNSQTRYFARAIRPNSIPHHMAHKIDREIFFGAGEHGDEIAKPDPRFCNLKLNVLRVLYASGAGEVLEKFWTEYERAGLASSSLGVSQEMDELLLAKLATI